MKMERIRKKLSPTVLEEMDAMSSPELERVIVQAETAISEATRERDENEKFQAAKQAVSDLSSGLRDVKGYQSAKIQYALLRLREGGGQ